MIVKIELAICHFYRIRQRFAKIEKIKQMSLVQSQKSNRKHDLLFACVVDLSSSDLELIVLLWVGHSELLKLSIVHEVIGCSHANHIALSDRWITIDCEVFPFVGCQKFALHLANDQ